MSTGNTRQQWKAAYGRAVAATARRRLTEAEARIKSAEAERDALQLLWQHFDTAHGDKACARPHRAVDRLVDGVARRAVDVRHQARGDDLPPEKVQARQLRYATVKVVGTLGLAAHARQPQLGRTWERARAVCVIL